MRYNIIFIILLSLGHTLSGQPLSIDYDIMGLGDQGASILAEEDGYVFAIQNSSPEGTRTTIRKVGLDGALVWEAIPFPGRYLTPCARDGVVKQGADEYLLLGSVWEEAVELFHLTFVKFNTAGDVLWERVYRTDVLSHAGAGGIKPTDDGGYLLWGDIRPGGTNRCWLIRTDAEGHLLWDKIVSSPVSRLDQHGNIEVLPDGDILLCYRSKALAGNEEAASLARLSPTGEERWHFTMPYLSTLGCQRLVRPLPGGGIALAECISDILGVGLFTSMVRGLDSVGNIQWTTHFPTMNGKDISNIRVADNGDIIGCGIDYGFPDPLRYSGWVFRMDGQGNLLWDRRYALDGLDNRYHFLTDLQETPSGHIACVGVVQTAPIAEGPNTNTWLLVLDEDGCLTPGCDGQNQVITSTDLVPRQAASTELHLYPNPARHQLWVAVPLDMPSGQARLRLLSMSGQLVREVEAQKGSTLIEMDTAGVPAGLYLTVLEVDGRAVGRGKVAIAGTR